MKRKHAMKLHMTKGVGIALAIAASCAVLGYIMAPGWWAFAAFSAWWGLVLAMGGKCQFVSVEEIDIDASDRIAQWDYAFHETTLANTHYRSKLTSVDH